MKKLLVLLILVLLALPVFAEEATPTPAPKTDSIAEGYVAPATATPAPTPELPPLRDDPLLQHVVEIAHRIDLLAESKLFCSYFVAEAVPDETLEKVSYGDHTRPAKVYHLNGQAFIAALYQGRMHRRSRISIGWSCAATWWESCRITSGASGRRRRCTCCRC